MEYYCIMVKTGEEEAFKKRATLAMQDDFPDAKFFFFYHMRKSNRGEFYERPMFVGYVFLQIEKLTPEFFSILRKVEGFIRLLRDNSDPTKFAGSALDELKLFIRNGEHWGVAKVKFTPDQKVRAISGFFEGLEGYVYRINHKKKTITITTSLTMTSKRIDVLYEEVEAVEEKSKS